MLYQEFVEMYCEDLIENLDKRNLRDSDELDDMFFYEDKVHTEDGGYRKVIYGHNNNPIYVSDIISLYLEDFLEKYPNDEKAYEEYMSRYIVQEGYDLILAYRERTRKELERIERESEYNYEDFFGN